MIRSKKVDDRLNSYISFMKIYINHKKRIIIKMVRIDSLYINNFRAIGDLKYSPKQINIIVGKNNTGKSALLDAIAINAIGYFDWEFKKFFSHKPVNFIKFGEKKAIIDSELNNVSIFADLGTFISDNGDTIIPEIFEKVVKNARNLSRFSTYYARKSSVDKNFEVEYLEMIKELFDFLIFSSKFGYAIFPYLKDENSGRKKFADESKQLIIKHAEKKSRDNRELIHRSNTIYHILYPEVIYIEKIINKNRQNIVKISHQNKLEFGDISEGELVIIEEFIRENNLIKNLKRLSEKDVVYQNNGDLITIPISAHGDGFIALLNTIRYLLKARDGILLIEEPENHLHPRYIMAFIEALFKYCSKINVQVFMTTHSYDLIKSSLEYPEEIEEKNLLLVSKMTSDGEKVEKFDYSVDEGIKVITTLYSDLRGN